MQNLRKISKNLWGKTLKKIIMRKKVNIVWFAAWILFFGVVYETPVWAAGETIDGLLQDGYINHINNIEIDLPDISKEYYYAVINDSHLICLNEEVAPDQLAFLGSRREGFRSPAGYYAEETFEAVIKAVDNLELDGVIFNGDIVDEASAGNYRLVYDVLENMETPYMYLQADHDTQSYWMNPHESQMRRLADKIGFSDDACIRENGEFVIVGLNHTCSSMSRQQFLQVKPYVKGTKPVILFSHVPYAPQKDSDFKAFVKNTRDSLIYWGGDRSLYQPDDVMQSWFRLMYREENPIKAVICGHIHGEHDAQLTETIDQYVCGPCFGGTLTIVKIY